MGRDWAAAVGRRLSGGGRGQRAEARGRETAGSGGQVSAGQADFAFLSSLESETRELHSPLASRLQRSQRRCSLRLRRVSAGPALTCKVPGRS